MCDRFEPDELAELLRYAAGKKVRLRRREIVDPQTTARHVWTGLSVARNMGLELGKYGLAPLTFEEQAEVVARIQYWFPFWCAAPVFYVDNPLVTRTDVFHGPRLAAGIRLWLDMVARHKVRVVLIDTVNKSEGRRLLKDTDEDARGYLTRGEILKLTAYARDRGVKVLWAGGITLPQAYTFGKLGVFGVYVTSDAATLQPLGRKARRDPFLVGLREPDQHKVARVKLALEAGFLVGRGATDLAADVEALLAAVTAGDSAKADALQTSLHPRMVRAWRAHLAKPHNREAVVTPPLKPPHLLKDARVYLSGPMDFVADRETEKKFGWRNRIGQVLRALGVVVFDPWFKPEIRGVQGYGREDEKDSVARAGWTFEDTKAGAARRSMRRGLLARTAHRSAHGGYQRLRDRPLSHERIQRRYAARDHPGAATAQAGPVREPSGRVPGRCENSGGTSNSRATPWRATAHRDRTASADQDQRGWQSESVVHAPDRRRALLRWVRFLPVPGEVRLAGNAARSRRAHASARNDRCSPSSSNSTTRYRRSGTGSETNMRRTMTGCCGTWRNSTAGQPSPTCTRRGPRTNNELTIDGPVAVNREEVILSTRARAKASLNLTHHDGRPVQAFDELLLDVL